MISQAIWAWLFLRFATIRGLRNTLRAMDKIDPQDAGIDPILHAQKRRLIRTEMRRRKIVF